MHFGSDEIDCQSMAQNTFFSTWQAAEGSYNSMPYQLRDRILTVIQLLLKRGELSISAVTALQETSYGLELLQVAVILVCRILIV